MALPLGLCGLKALAVIHFPHGFLQGVGGGQATRPATVLERFRKLLGVALRAIQSSDTHLNIMNLPFRVSARTPSRDRSHVFDIIPNILFLSNINPLATKKMGVPQNARGKWWPGEELNHRRKDFQSFALPLSYPAITEMSKKF